MAKIKTAYYCQNCGSRHSQWMGRCSQCGEWNTISEEILSRGNKESSADPRAPQSHHKIQKIGDIAMDESGRMATGDEELDRVLGGGLVPGSVVLVGGEPGIGKSTLMLQLALSAQKDRVLYISGEESAQQLKMRAERIGRTSDNCFILTETRTQEIFHEIRRNEPGLLIVDSIQTTHTAHIESSPGSVSQIRESASEFMRFAKEKRLPVILIGHITKEGSLAGPKVLEHMVDVVLQFEGDRNHLYRLLRAQKNRFGSTAELGVYEMRESGLQAVSNPSEMLISRREERLSGTAVACTLEGMRPMMIEVQALVSSAVYGVPQRSSTGFDTRRLNMLLAVLEKRCGFRLGAKDVFLNITGGIRVNDPAADLAVMAAILSSNSDIPVADKCCFAAEVGLAGEIRPANRIDRRIVEAEKLGYEEIIISRYSKPEKKNYAIKVTACGKIEDVVGRLFG